MRRNTLYGCVAAISIALLALFFGHRASQTPPRFAADHNSSPVRPTVEPLPPPAPAERAARVPQTGPAPLDFVEQLPTTELDRKVSRTVRQLDVLKRLPPATDHAEPVLSDTKFPDGINEVSISPDGKLLAFSGKHEDNTSDVYLYAFEQGTLKNLTQALPLRGEHIAGHRFSPDGRQIIVSGFPYSGLSIIDLQTGVIESLVENSRALAPNWSFDGKLITYTVADNPAYIEVFDVKTKTVIKKIPGSGSGAGRTCESAFSPDGKSLVYVKEEQDNGRKTRSLVLHQLETDEVKTFTFPGHDVHTPVYAPDGQSIAYRGGTRAWGEIYVFSVADAREKQVTSGSGARPCWSADSKRLLFESQRTTGTINIYSLSIAP